MENSVKTIDRDLLLQIIFNYVNKQMSFPNKKHLIDVVTNTTFDNWKKACNIVVYEDLDLRLWQVVAEFDFRFPVPVWADFQESVYAYLPDNYTILLALENVAMVYHSGKVIMN